MHAHAFCGGRPRVGSWDRLPVAAELARRSREGGIVDSYDCPLVLGPQQTAVQEEPFQLRRLLLKEFESDVFAETAALAGAGAGIP